MLNRKLIFLILCTNLLFSCRNSVNYSFAIKDFNKQLQPYLTRIISIGVLMDNDSSLRYTTTDDDLLKLARSEHPILRAAAFREMFSRKSIDHFKIMMNHLDDTAIIVVDNGEWGFWYTTVSDNIIDNARWKTLSDKDKTIDEVITKHNYLRSAYTILLNLQPKEKYYPYIRDMALRRIKSLEGNYNSPRIKDVECALYGLAKFKKKEDVPIIKNLLMENSWYMNDFSFRLMEEFPDTSYIDVLEEYYKYDFYKYICIKGTTDNAVQFVRTVAKYKSSKAANILSSILNKKPFLRCNADSFTLKEEAVYAVWENPCEAYSKLRKQVESNIREYEKSRVTIPPSDPVEIYEEPAEEKIKW